MPINVRIGWKLYLILFNLLNFRGIFINITFNKSRFLCMNVEFLIYNWIHISRFQEPKLNCGSLSLDPDVHLYKAPPYDCKPEVSSGALGLCGPQRA